MHRRTFIATAALGLAAPYLVPARARTNDIPSHFLLSEHGCGRATGYAEANKIVTAGDKTHVAWLDSEGETFRVRIRTLDRSSNLWSDTYTLGDAFDNHGGPALTVDSQGYLHIVYYPHHHPMRYRKSLRPNDASEWGPEEQFGEELTYPTLVCGPDDTLYFTCRQGGKREKWRCVMFTKKPDGPWEGPVALIDSQHPSYSHFMDALCWGPDHKSLHLSTRIYSGKVRYGHTVGYMRSDDFGQTWQTAAGETITTPATAASIDIVDREPPNDRAGLRAGSIAVSPEGTPYILYSDYSQLPLTTWLAWPDEQGIWHRRDLRPFIPAAYADWGLITPGEVVIAHDGTLYVCASLVNTAEGQGLKGLWGRVPTEILVLHSEDGGETFTSRVVSDPALPGPHWLPSMERPTGHNTVAKPGLMYTAGGPGEKNTEIVSNRVYWVNW